MTRVRKYSDMFVVVNEKGNEVSLKKADIERTLPPRTALITCGAEGLRETYEKNLLKSLKMAQAMDGNAWVHLVYSLEHGLYRFKAYTEFEYRHLEENALLEFILRLNHIISTYHTYRTDISRYRLSLKDEPDVDP